jgi:hypothetical protein
LDYAEKSDLDDSVGFWYVIPHPDNPEHWTRVYYSVELSVFPWMPQFVVDFLSKKALTDATAWVRLHSELEAEKLPQPDTTDSAAQTAKKPRRNWFGRKKKEEEEIISQVSDDDTCVEDIEVVTKIGMTRYVLLCSVLLLAQYNLYLYLSQ